MNLKILITPILVFSSLIFTTKIQIDFQLNNRAVAQDSVELQESVINLSLEEKASLEKGMVILQGQKGNYLGQVLADGNIEIAWEVLTDYENFDRFLPNIASSKILEEQGDRIVFEQVNVVDLWLFKQEFKVQIEASKSKPTHVNFKIVDGDLKKLIGRWEIVENAPGKILVRHAVEVEPGSNTEKPFFYGVYESSLEDTLEAIALEISRRSK